MSGYGAVAAPMHRDWPHWPPCIAEKTNVGVDFLKLDEVRLLEVGTPQHSACSESFWRRASIGRDRFGRLGIAWFAYQGLYLAS